MKKSFAALQREVLEWYGADVIGRYVDLDRPSMRAHVLTAGEGEPVVLLHGGGDEAMIWAPLLARLQDEWGLYAPDRPGCGMSDGFVYDQAVDLRAHATEFVCSLLDALGIERANVIACSAGAYFALAAALDRPERFRRLAFAGYPLGIADPGPFRSSSPGVRALQLAGGLPVFGRLFELMHSRIDAETARELYAEEFDADVSRYPDCFFEAKVASIRRPGATGSFASLVRQVFDVRGLSPPADLTDEVSDLAVPSLFLWGDRDLAPPETGREAVAPISGATFEVVDGAGHLVFHDTPDRTAERIAEFFG